jgi:Putative DNA-binding domain
VLRPAPGGAPYTFVLPVSPHVSLAEREQDGISELSCQIRICQSAPIAMRTWHTADTIHRLVGSLICSRIRSRVAWKMLLRLQQLANSPSYASGKVDMTEPRAKPVTFLWNPELHRVIANEQLVFMLLGFDPLYRRNMAVSHIKAAMASLGVRSYAIWELIGDHDVVIQAWLPRGITTSRVQDQLADVSTLTFDSLSMSVEQTIYHWMWDKPIDLDAHEAHITSDDYVNLNDRALRVPARRISQYQKYGYVHKAPTASDMKFFLRVTNPHRAISSDGKRQLVDLARKVVLDPIVRGGVVYQVSGDAGCYLITGRIQPKRYEDIASMMRDTLGSTGLLDSVKSRTTTHISAFAMPLDRREQLLPTREEDAISVPDEPSVTSWLHRVESDDLEFKASAFTDIRSKVSPRQTAAGHLHAQETERANARSAAEQVSSVAKAVIGMLNADGGTIVIGVAETDKFDADSFSSVYRSVRRVGSRAVIGVDDELGKDGWDGYQRRLATRLRNLVTGEIGGRVRYFPVPFDSKTLCVIRVQRSSSWHWLKVKDSNGQQEFRFFGREGGETRYLHAPQAEEFKESHPRTSRPPGE